MNHKRKKISFQPDNYHTVMILIAMLNILLIDYMVSLNGSGYVGLSLFMFWVIASVCSLWFSSLTAKVIRQKISQSQNKSAKSFWKTALICNVFPNALLSLTFFIFSDPVCQFLFLNRNMSLCVKIIALSFIPFGLICLLSGYLKGIGLLNPVRLVLIIQQVLIFIFSVTGLWVVSEYGEKVSQLLNNVEIMAVYKATGALAGALLGIIIGILLLCVFILILHKNQKESFSNDQHKNYDSFRYEIQTVFRYGISHILFSLTVLLVPLIDFIFYIRSEKTSSDITEIMQLAGVLFSVVLPLIIILLTLWKKILFSFEYFMRNALKEQNFQLFKEYVFGILRGCMAVMLPVTILLVILSESVLKLLFGSAVQPDHITMFRVGSILVFFLSYLLVLLQILRQIGMSSISVLFSLISFMLQTFLGIFLIILYSFGIRGFFGSVYADIVINTGLLLWYLGKRIHASFLFQRSVLVNAALAFFTGFLIYLLYQNVCSAWQPLAAIFVCIFFYTVVYLFGMAVLPVMNEDDAGFIPGGALFLQIKKLLHKEERGV